MPSSTNQSQSPRDDANTTHAAIAAINQLPNSPPRPSAELAGSILFATGPEYNDGNAKRSSDDDRSNKVDGYPSPQKSKQRTDRNKPNSAAAAAATTVRFELPPVDDSTTADPMVIDALPTPAAVNDNHITITPSPTVDTTKNAAATKKKKKKSGPTTVVVGNKILEFLRQDTFNKELFQLKKKDQVKGEAYKKAEYEIIYTEKEMDKFDSSYQKFLIYDFDLVRRESRQWLWTNIWRYVIVTYR